MYRQVCLSAAMAVACLWAVNGLAADNCCNPCDCCEPEVQYVEKTIYCPTWVTETRTVKTCEYKTEERQREVTTYKRVAETRIAKKTVCDMVPETRTRTCEYTVSKPVWKDVTEEYQVCVPVWTEVEQTCTVMVPHQETRTGTRTVCRRVPVTVTKTVCVDEGCWQKQMVEVPCRRKPAHRKGCGCGSCCEPCEVPTRTVCRRVWVPNIVKKEIQCTSCKVVKEQVPCEYTVTVYKPETRTKMVKVCSYKTELRTRTARRCHIELEKKTREVCYTVCIAKTREVEVPITTYRCIPETCTQTYTVCVPVHGEKEVEVRVCKMVPKTVKVPVCNDCCPRRRCKGC